MGPRREIDIRHGFKRGNDDYCSHISVTFETTGKFLFVFVRLILDKKGLTELPGHGGKLT